MSDNRPIGIFDSGLGGLTVVRAVQKLLPEEQIIYLGDTARVPYGNKSVENITKFGLNNSAFLLEHNVKLIIVACNSVSAVAIDILRQSYPDTPIIGVIEAGVAACLEFNIDKITVTGTRATINSNVYSTSLTEANPSAEVQSIPCPLFVPLAEEGVINHTITTETIKLYLSALQNTTEPQLLLLGCTHYPLLKKAISRFVDPQITIIDSANACANFTSQFLTRNDLLSCANGNNHTQFYVTDKPAEFKTQSSRFFGHEISEIKLISL